MSSNLVITVDYRDGHDEDYEAVSTRFGDGMYVMQNTTKVASMIPLDRIASITEERID